MGTTISNVSPRDTQYNEVLTHASTRNKASSTIQTQRSSSNLNNFNISIDNFKKRKGT
jgi:hypothetical protein